MTTPHTDPIEREAKGIAAYAHPDTCDMVERAAVASLTRIQQETERRVVERVKELVAHSSYSIDAGGHVENKSQDVVDVCHEIIKDLEALTTP